MELPDKVRVLWPLLKDDSGVSSLVLFSSDRGQG